VAVLGVGAPVAHASLSVPTGGPPTTFSSLTSFEAAAGGADNGTTSGEQGSGYRHAGWDGLAANGSDPGSTVIEPGHVVAVSPTALEPWGIEVGPEVAVANDGFRSVNSNALFTPFSPPNVWGPFNSTTAEFDVVAPGAQASSPVPAQTRGLGIVFLNATGATQIQYYNGDILLGSVSAAAGSTSFAGLLFPDPVVTRVVVTLGGAEIFAFDGSTVTPGGNNPEAADDIVLAEPAPARPAATATAGVPISPVLDTFTNTDAAATAVIDWGDGTRTPGTIVSAPGGAFNVTGTHAYAATGGYTATVTVRDFAGDEQSSQTLIGVAPRASSTILTCSPASVAMSASTVCTAIVSDASTGGASSPTGLVAFSSPTPGAAFPAAGSCILGPTGAAGISLCEVQFEPEQRPPVQARITASYVGDALHAASDATSILAVHKQRCSLTALSRRLRPGGFWVIVTCDARTTVAITAQALVARRRPFRAFRLSFGSGRSLVVAGRPTVMVVKPGRGVLPTLRSALHRHQHLSLRLTLTASSNATRTTTTKRVSAIRLY
jgi:hypothetical protein